MNPTQSEVTAEMVERGAIGLWLTYKRERVSGSSKDWYRRKARAVLEAALGEQP